MKKLMLIPFLAISLALYSQSDGSFTVTAQISGLKEGDTVYFLCRKYSNAPVDTLVGRVKKNESVSFNVSFCEGPVYYRLQPAKTEKKLYLFLDNSSIEIKGKLDDLEHATVKGSKSQNDYTDYNVFVQSVIDEMNKHGLQNNSLIVGRVNTIIDTYILEHANSLFCPVVLLDSRIDPVKTKFRYEKLTDEVKLSKYGKELKEAIDNVSK